jgi:hypothetical protein
LNDRPDDLGCNAAEKVLRPRRSAALAIAARAKGDFVRKAPVHALRCERLRRLESVTRNQPAKSSAVKEAAKGLAKAMIPPKSETTPATSHKIQCLFFFRANNY